MENNENKNSRERGKLLAIMSIEFEENLTHDLEIY